MRIPHPFFTAMLLLVTIPSLHAQQWQYSSPNAYYNGGNVGIGTSSPGAILEVNTTGNNALKISSNDHTSIHFVKASATDYGTVSFFTGTTRNYFMSHYNDGTFRISREGTNHNDFVLASSGNVGIGTSSPGAKLDVAGNTSSANTAQFGNFGIQSFANSNSILSQNMYWNGSSTVYRQNGAIGLIQILDGDILFAQASPGISGGIATLKYPVTIKQGAADNTLYLNASGNVGIGSGSPDAKLTVGNGSQVVTIKQLSSGRADYQIFSGGNTTDYGGAYMYGGAYGSNYLTFGLNDAVNATNEGSAIYFDTRGGSFPTLRFMVKAAGTSSMATAMSINAAGNVGIGTTTLPSPDAKLAVNGNIYSTKVKVTQNGWADYVFDAGYRLRPLSEVEQYIQQHHHLPEVPTTADVEKDGLDLGDNQTTLLKKIEELTLYLIEQNKKLEKQQIEINTLKKQLQQRK